MFHKVHAPTSGHLFYQTEYKIKSPAQQTRIVVWDGQQELSKKRRPKPLGILNLGDFEVVDVQASSVGERLYMLGRTGNVIEARILDFTRSTNGPSESI